MKYLDMPEGNGVCSIYDQFVGQIDRKRSVAIINVIDPHGDMACYIYSGDYNDELSAENTIEHCVDMVQRARARAERDGLHPLEINTLDLQARRH